MRFFEKTHFPFIGLRLAGYILSALLILTSLTAIFSKGLQYGIDFRGGVEIVIEPDVPVSVSETRDILSEFLDSPVVRTFGSGNELQIRVPAADIEEIRSVVTRAFQLHQPSIDIAILKMDLIGPSMALDMRDAAFISALLSVFVIALYIFIRFRKFYFSFSVLVTLLHDVIIILGIFTLLNGILPFNLDIDQSLIAAFLTIIGYSLNDTIVVFDRIRENQRIHRNTPWDEMVNTSINQTLSRTVVTSLTTFFAVTALFLFGGATLKGFSFAIMLGVILGTYSTIFISCPLLVDIKNKNPMTISTAVKTKRKEFAA